MLKGKMLRDALISGGNSIQNNRKKVDQLNVYPVPDGDTGTNMSLTMSSAVRELELMDDSVTVSQVADAAASALLRGARGNSGVILSLIFRGFSKGLSGLSTADCADLAKALEIGVDAAYKSVMNPTEGTVLTVSRAAAEKAKESAEYSGSIQSFWNDVCTAAQTALDKTPEQLPVLKKAGVVDAGGQGLVIIFDAMLSVFSGNEPEKNESIESVSKTFEIQDAAADADEDIRFSYCTEFIVEKKENCRDPFMLRAYLETIGDCVVVVDDDEIIKVHVHTDNPGLAIQKGLEFGRFVNEPKPKIENMRIQHENRIKEKKITSRQEFVPVDPVNEFGFVAVAAGKGLESVFRDLGADCVIMGGQTMNPSTDDILKAIHSTPAKNVFVLPNNKNIIMAAEKVKELTQKRVEVIPTAEVAQGIRAAFAFDINQSVDVNVEEMKNAYADLKCGEVTNAVRNTNLDGFEISEGDIIGLDGKTIIADSKSVEETTLAVIDKLVDEWSEVITLYYGEGVSKEDVEKLTCKLKEKYEDFDVVSYYGGQPHYYYLISIE